MDTFLIKMKEEAEKELVLCRKCGIKQRSQDGDISRICERCRISRMEVSSNDSSKL